MNAKPSEKNKNEAPTICRVCFDSFASDPQKRPRMLTCGHSFCHTCLKRVMTEQENMCPSCKQMMNYATVEEVPVNYELLDAAKFISNLSLTVSSSHASEVRVAETMSLGAIALQKKKKVIKENQLKYEGHCNEHYLPNNFKCMDCSLWICGNCQFMKHKKCQVVLYEEAVMSLKDKTNDSINKLKEKHKVKLKVLTSNINNEHKICEELTSILITTENLLETHKNQKVEEENIIKNLTEHQESVMKSQTVTDFEKVKNSFEEFLKKSNIVAEASEEDIQTMKMKDIKKLNTFTVVLDPFNFCEKNKVNLCQKLQQGGHVKHGRIEVGSDDRTRIHHFAKSTSNVNINPIQFENVISNLKVAQYLPLEVFFKIYRCVNYTNIFFGEFIIQVDSLSPRAINFILAASGILHSSYQGNHLNNNGTTVGNYNNNVPALVKDIQDESRIYSCEGGRGRVGGIKAQYDNYYPQNIGYPTGNTWNMQPYYDGFSGMEAQANRSSEFWIYRMDSHGRDKTSFGHVTKGMEVIDQIQDNDFVKECGLII